MLKISRMAPRIPQDAAPVVFELPHGVDERVHLCRVGAVERAQTQGRTSIPALCGDDVLVGSVATRSEKTCSACFAQPHRRPGRPRPSRPAGRAA